MSEQEKDKTMSAIENVRQKYAASLATCVTEHDKVAAILELANRIEKLEAAPRINRHAVRTEASIVEALKNLLGYAYRHICDHAATHRGGAIWTICDDCGMKWADDDGGFKPDPIPDAILQAEAAITAYEATNKESG